MTRSTGGRNLSSIETPIERGVETTMKTNQPVPSSELRKFGIAFGVFLSIIATVILWRMAWRLGPVTTTLYVVAVILAGIGIVVPELLRGFFGKWMKLARALGWLNTNILLTLIFYIVFTPVSFGIRLFGGDLLAERKGKNDTSHWRKVVQQKPSPERYRRQF